MWSVGSKVRSPNFARLFAFCEHLVAKAPLLLPPPAQPPALSFLASDSSEDEGIKLAAEAKGRKAKGDKSAPATTTKKPSKREAAIPKSLKDIPKHLPNPPPKHTYLRTAVSPRGRYPLRMILTRLGTNSHLPLRSEPSTHSNSATRTLFSFKNLYALSSKEQKIPYPSPPRYPCFQTAPIPCLAQLGHPLLPRPRPPRSNRIRNRTR